MSGLCFSACGVFLPPSGQKKQWRSFNLATTKVTLANGNVFLTIFLDSKHTNISQLYTTLITVSWPTSEFCCCCCVVVVFMYISLPLPHSAVTTADLTWGGVTPCTHSSEAALWLCLFYSLRSVSNHIKRRRKPVNLQPFMVCGLERKPGLAYSATAGERWWWENYIFTPNTFCGDTLVL